MPELIYTGSYEECENFTKREIGAYPPGGYGTWFNWPPNTCKDVNGKPIQYKAPISHPNGEWTVRGHRSSSCD